MAALKCLACGHDNRAEDESCSSCASSLNLKLCSACEAINANSAERCHSCGAAFIAPEPAAPPALEDAVAFVDLTPPKWLPAKARLVQAALPAGGRARTIAAWMAPLVIVAAVAAYYLNIHPSAVNAKPSAIAAAPAAPAPAAPQAHTPPAKPIAKAPEADAKPVNSAQSRVSMEPKRQTAVTHTRTGAEAAPPAVSATAPTKSFPPKPVAAPAKAAPEMNNVAAALTGPAVAAPAVPAYARVTHTRPPEPGTAPIAVPRRPALKDSDSSPACAPAAAALGFCIAK